MNSQSAIATPAKRRVTSADERLAKYGNRTLPGSALRVVVGDGSAFYSAAPILVYVVLSEGGSKGVDDHDRVASLDKRDNVPFEGVLSRLIDTIDLVAGLIIAEGEQQVLIAETMREIHRHIEGNLEDGRRYHAWNKDLWAWTWAGIIKPSLDAYERLHGPVSIAFAEDAYIGALQIGDLIGVRGLPETYSEFLNYWEHQWIPLAGGTGTGKFLMSLIDGMPQPAAAPWIPKPIWHAMTWPLRHFMATSAFIVMEPRVLQMLGVEPTRGQRVGVGAHRLFWRLIPRAVTRNWFETAIKLRLRYGRNSWDHHYSPQALAQYHQQVDEASAQGCPRPARPSKRY